MPPELALRLSGGRLAAVGVWRGPLIHLAAAWTALAVLARGAWSEMAHQWWDISTYNHMLLIPPILVWLVRLRAAELARLTPHSWWPGLVALFAAAATWLAGTISGVNLIAQAGAVFLLQAAVLTMLGPRVAMALLFPLAYSTFLVPFGDEIVPTLQAITAHIAVGLTHVSGVPARIEGVFIDTPAGLFEVAEACSGVKFLIAMAALGTLTAHLGFLSWKRRVAFLAAALTVPVLANGVRAWGTIYLAQFLGVAFAAGFDHVVYGWFFFALVIATLLGAAWRFFDRSPDDNLIDVEALHASPWLAHLDRYTVSERGALAATLAFAAAAALLSLAVIPARP